MVLRITFKTDLCLPVCTYRMISFTNTRFAGNADMHTTASVYAAQISLLFLKNRHCKFCNWLYLAYFCYAVPHSRSSFHRPVYIEQVQQWCNCFCLNFFFNNRDYFMGTMKYFAHLSNWYHEVTPYSESVWRSIIPGISCQQLMAQGIQRRLQKDYSQAIIL